MILQIEVFDETGIRTKRTSKLRKLTVSRFVEEALLRHLDLCDAEEATRDLVEVERKKVRLAELLVLGQQRKLTIPESVELGDLTQPGPEAPRVIGS